MRLARASWVVALVWAVSAVRAQAADRSSRDIGHEFSLRAALETEYDDNIIQLSQRDKQRFKDNPNSNRFVIDSIDDTVVTGSFDFRWKMRPIRKRETTVSFSVDAYRYARNSVKNYEEFRLALAQELTASSRHLAVLRGWMARTPYFYTRQLTDADASFDLGTGQILREKATFAENEYGLSYEQEIINRRLDARLGLVRQERNYNDHFNERDSTDDSWTLAAGGRPSRASGVRLGLAYERGDLDARGDLLSTPIPDADVSYRHRTWSFEAEIPWGDRMRGRLRLEATRETRDATTDNSFDDFHFMRHDDRRDYRARLTQRLTQRFDLLAELRRRSNDVTFPVDFASNDEVTDYTENRISVGVAWRGVVKK